MEEPPQSHPNDDLSPPTTILRLGAEGGGISLIGHQNLRQQWRFLVTLTDQTPVFLACDDAVGEITRRTEWVVGWDSAIKLLDKRFPYWTRLHPIAVHADFKDAVLAAVLARRGAEVSASWNESIQMKERVRQNLANKQ